MSLRVLRGERKYEMEFDELSNKVIGCALEVHKRLGPGLLESAYERCLSFELISAGIRHSAQKELPYEKQTIAPRRKEETRRKIYIIKK